MSPFIPFIALLAAVFVAVTVLSRPRGSRAGRVFATLARLVVVVLGGIAAAALWYFHRPQPPPKTEILFRGVTYERDVRSSPRPLVVHVVRIDLRAPGIGFLVTPPDEGGVLRGATTSQFATRHQVQLAVNGDFFLPWWSDGPADFYPHPGDAVDALGTAVSGEQEYGWRMAPFTTLVLDEEGGAAILEVNGVNTVLPRTRQAISGKPLLVDGGARTAAASARRHGTLHPRTAVALDRSRSTLLLFVIDGRQPGYSEGVTLEELADIVLSHGGHRAMNLDGGGSSALVVVDDRGEPRQLNCPIHTRIPWRERPVANHLGVFARALEEP